MSAHVQYRVDNISPSSKKFSFKSPLDFWIVRHKLYWDDDPDDFALLNSHFLIRIVQDYYEWRNSQHSCLLLRIAYTHIFSSSSSLVSSTVTRLLLRTAHVITSCLMWILMLREIARRFSHGIEGLCRSEETIRKEILIPWYRDLIGSIGKDPFSCLLVGIFWLRISFLLIQQ